MKNQYFGDINDYKKYGLLRIIGSVTGKKIGVCWMLTDDDGGRDGEKRDFLEQHRNYAQFDPDLFRSLSRVKTSKERDVKNAEKWNILQDASYFTDIITDATDRASYFNKALTHLQHCPIIFFDPDNGFEVSSTRKGRKNSSKFIFYDELLPFYQAGKAIIVYQHFPRVERKIYIETRKQELKRALGCGDVFVFATPWVAFFLVLQNSSDFKISDIHSQLNIWRSHNKPLISLM